MAGGAGVNLVSGYDGLQNGAQSLIDDKNEFMQNGLGVGDEDYFQDDGFLEGIFPGLANCMNIGSSDISTRERGYLTTRTVIDVVEVGTIVKGLYSVGSKGLTKISGLGDNLADDVAKQSDNVYKAPSGGGGVTSSLKISGKTINFGHGGRHLTNEGIDLVELHKIIGDDVVNKSLKTDVSQPFRVKYNGKTIEYRAIELSDGTINVGIYYIPNF